MSDFFKKYKRDLCILITIFVLGFPVVLGVLVYSPLFHRMPGDANAWFAFWASYSGALVSVFIAFITVKLNKGLEDMNKQLGEKENAFLNLMTGVNIRVENIYMIPCVAESTCDTSVYKFVLVLKNLSYSPVKDISVQRAAIQIKEKMKECACEYSFYWQENTPSVELTFSFEKGSIEERRLTQFYFYYSQLRAEMNLLRLELELLVKPLQMDSKSKADKKIDSCDQRLNICMALKVLPEIDKSLLQNQLFLNRYLGTPNKISVLKYDMKPISSTANSNEKMTCIP